MDARWTAIANRDPNADGQFFYSVKTTGVYCRPSCGARLAKRENVAFHDTAVDAERAGFRPCKRCRPDRNSNVPTTIRFAVGKCSLGFVLVAQSEKGVCAILLGDSWERLAGELRERFSAARRLSDTELEPVVTKVVRVVENPRLPLDIALDVRGTEFQERVWQALRSIPVGSTVSYADLAQRIGARRAVRAVAQACAANVLAVVIPCHRVVRQDGGLSGYRWGVGRKRALLEREGAR